VTLLVINNSRTETTIEVPLESKRYTLSAEPLRRSDVELNGATLNVDDGGDLPAIEGAATTAGSVSFAPGTITFLAIERSGNSACRGSYRGVWMVGRAPPFSAVSADAALCRRRAALPSLIKTSVCYGFIGLYLLAPNKEHYCGELFRSGITQP
jgi:hypothetical protein